MNTCHIYAYPQLPYIIWKLDYIAREAKNDWKMAVRHQHSPNMVVTVNAKYSIKMSLSSVTANFC